jgi:hypothetical protein
VRLNQPEDEVKTDYWVRAGNAATGSSSGLASASSILIFDDLIPDGLPVPPTTILQVFQLGDDGVDAELMNQASAAQAGQLGMDVVTRMSYVQQSAACWAAVAAVAVCTETELIWCDVGAAIGTFAACSSAVETGIKFVAAEAGLGPLLELPLLPQMPRCQVT